MEDSYGTRIQNKVGIQMHMSNVEQEQKDEWLFTWGCGFFLVTKFWSSVNKLVHCIMTLSPLWQVQTTQLKLGKVPWIQLMNKWFTIEWKTKKMHPQLINKLESNPSKII